MNRTTADPTGGRWHRALSRWHDLERRADRSSLSLFVSEAVGTALLLVGGLSAVTLVISPASPLGALHLPDWAARACAGALFGLTGTAVTLSRFGRHSGAHINPAVTLAFWLTGKISTSHAVGYVVSQALGAVAGAGAVLVWGAYGRPIRFGATVPETGLAPGVAVGLEALCTAVLVVVLFTFLSSRSLRHLTPWTMGPLYAVMVCLEAPLTGTSTNPARSFGPALITGTWTLFWVYLVGPFLGAVVGVRVARLLAWGEHRFEEARLVIRRQRNGSSPASTRSSRSP